MNDLHPAREIFRRSPIPRAGAKADLVLFEENPGLWPEFWTIRLYNDNLRLLRVEDQLTVAKWLQHVMDEMKKSGIIVFVEKWTNEQEPGDD